MNGRDICLQVLFVYSVVKNFQKFEYLISCESDVQKFEPTYNLSMKLNSIIMIDDWNISCIS